MWRGGLWGCSFQLLQLPSFFQARQAEPPPQHPRSPGLYACAWAALSSPWSRGPLAPPGCSPRRLWPHPRCVQRVRLGSNRGLRACAQAGPPPAESLRSAPGTVLLQRVRTPSSFARTPCLGSLVPHLSDVTFHSAPSISAAVFALLHLNTLLGGPSAHILLWRSQGIWI